MFPCHTPLLQQYTHRRTNTAVCKRMPAYHKARLQGWLLTTSYRNLFDFFFFTRVIGDATQSHGVRNFTLHWPKKCHESLGGEKYKPGYDSHIQTPRQHPAGKNHSSLPNTLAKNLSYAVEALPRNVATVLLQKFQIHERSTPVLCFTSTWRVCCKMSRQLVTEATVYTED